MLIKATFTMLTVKRGTQAPIYTYFGPLHGSDEGALSALAEAELRDLLEEGFAPVVGGLRVRSAGEHVQPTFLC